jgi:hypothetical protein
MQAFYPPTLKHRLVLAALLLLVLCVHLAGLRALSVSWPTQPGDTIRLSLQWQVAAPSVVTAIAAPTVAPPRKPAKPRPTRSEPEQGFYAPSPAPESAPTQPEPAAAAEAMPNEEPPLAQTETPPEEAVTSAPSVETADTLPEPTQAATPDAPPPTETSVPVPATETADIPAAPAWLTQARFVWPQPVKLQYDVLGESKGIRFNANGELLWQHDGVNYQMKLDISHMLMGSRIQTSVGQLGPQGLQPKRFGEKNKQEVAAHFEREKGQVVFSANSTPQALQLAAQDRLSMFAQLAAVLAGTPELRQTGQLLSFQIVSSKSAELWSFQVARSELLDLPAGKLTALKVSRLPLQNHDQTADIWLAPAHGYLPVKVRIVQSNGDVFEQSLRKVVGP